VFPPPSKCACRVAKAFGPANPHSECCQPTGLPTIPRRTSPARLPPCYLPRAFACRLGLTRLPLDADCRDVWNESCRFHPTSASAPRFPLRGRSAPLAETPSLPVLTPFRTLPAAAGHLGLRASNVLANAGLLDDRAVLWAGYPTLTPARGIQFVRPLRNGEPKRFTIFNSVVK
jgi:hypothetical protein